MRRLCKKLIAMQELLQKDHLNEELILEEKRCREDYVRVHSAYIYFLQQKAKMNWGREGDMNTKLYPLSIKGRNRQNHISSVEKENGERIDNAGKLRRSSLKFIRNI